MIKWIGQHIWDFVSRFRNDVYLEGVSTDTIASGGNLGLDSNNKIVKAAVVGNTDTKIWQTILPGNTTSINNTLYYARSTSTFLEWTAADSNPATSVTHAQFAVPFFIANVGAGSITGIRMQGTATSTDPFALYFYKAAASNDESNEALTSMFNTTTITPDSANKTYSFSSDPSGSNTFSADDRLYIFIKKISNGGSSNNYYTISVSGEYT